MAFGTSFQSSVTGDVTFAGFSRLPAGETSTGATLFAQLAPSLTVNCPVAETTASQFCRVASTYQRIVPAGSRTSASVAAVRRIATGAAPSTDTHTR
jgi:hypothetical protein